MKGSMKVEGFGDLDQALALLPKSVGVPVLVRTLQAAAEPMVEEASALAPDDPATPAPDLHTEIVTSRRQQSGRRTRRGEEGVTVTLYFGPSTKVAKEAMPQEFGSVPHAIGGGMHPGNPPRPYMRPAFFNNVEKSIGIMAATLGPEIIKAAKRLAKRRAKALARARSL